MDPYRTAAPMPPPRPLRVGDRVRPTLAAVEIMRATWHTRNMTRQESEARFATPTTDTLLALIPDRYMPLADVRWDDGGGPPAQTRWFTQFLEADD